MHKSLSNRLLRHLRSLLVEHLSEFRASVQATGVQNYAADALLQLLPAFLPLAFFALGPFGTDASGYFQDGTKLRDPVLEAVIVDKSKDQRRSFAK
jgi:hypothetical protein